MKVFQRKSLKFSVSLELWLQLSQTLNKALEMKTDMPVSKVS